MRSVAAVIIGNGVAGITAARALSDAGVEVEVYTRESSHYYPRPRLQEFLAGEMELEELPLYSPSWYEKRGITVHLGTEVVGLDPASKQIALAACAEPGADNGRQVTYDRLLLAVGSSPFVPAIEGTNRSGVFTYRTIEDVLAIKRWAGKAEQAVIIGCGLLGLEAARGLRKLGLEVNALERGSYPLPRQLDAEGGALLKKLIGDLGIEVILNASAQAVLGDETSPLEEGGTVAGVVLQDGRRIPADLVLISAGVRSNVGLAQEAGLEVNRGVVVDAHLRTSAEDIYAAGDVAEFEGQVYGIIPAAIEQARAAAQSMLGEEVAYEGTVRSNTLQVAGIDCTSIGVVHPPEGEGYRELRKCDDRVYKKLVLKDGRLVGAILLGDRKNVGPISRLVKTGAVVVEEDHPRYAERLLDDDFNWRELL